MRNAQLIEMNVIVPPDMNLGVPYELVLTDPDGDRNVTIQIKKVGENMPINPKSILACLQKYFDEIERDAAVSPNTVCRKGCCGCCYDTEVFEHQIRRRLCAKHLRKSENVLSRRQVYFCELYRRVVQHLRGSSFDLQKVWSVRGIWWLFKA